MSERTDSISPQGVDVVGAGLTRQNLREADSKSERNLNKHKHFENIQVNKNVDSDIEQQNNLNNSIDDDFEEDSEHEKYNVYITSNSISSDIESDVDRDELQPKSSPEDRRYSQHLSGNINPYRSTFGAEEARLRFSLESVQYKDRAVSLGAPPNLEEPRRPAYSLNDSLHDVNKLSAGINSQSSSPNPKSFQISPLQGFQGQEQGSRSSLNLSFDEDSNAAFIPRIKEGLYFCHLCSFSGSTQQDFDLHMTVHFEHVCPHCDYKSRTEGRLKRHIKDFHTEDPDGGYGARTMPGRPKVFRCKQCEYSTIDKLEFWSHSRSHIKEDKLLQCPRCPFVTEYKHHLEYHLRNHFGSKPFKCPKCNYACVNKSMLNSHMKSHTNVYQYRCADCTYATKYCHSLKLHLRKYNHKPAAVLNSDGSLPQGVDATASGLSLLAKRGPPRGPRGPRKDKMDPGMNSFHPMPVSPIGPLSALQGMIPPPFWPMMHNRFPGSFPGSLGLGHRFNTHLPGMPVITQAKSPEEIKSPIGGNPSHNPNKCNFCNFVGTNQETLTSHVMKVHATENRDLFSMFGLSSESLLEDNQMRMNPSHMFRTPIKFPRMENVTGSPPDCFHGIKKELTDESPKIKATNENDGAVKETTKMSLFPFLNGKFQVNSQFLADSHKAEVGMDILKQMTLKFGSGPVDLKPKLPSMSFANDFTTADSPLDLTKPRHAYHLSSHQAMSASHSYKYDEAEGDSSGENSVYSNELTSPPPRKRSRKGKAFKLDTLVMKLQEKKKDACNSDEDSDVDMDEMYTSDLLPVEADKNPAEHQAKYEESIDVEENSSNKIKSSDTTKTDEKKDQKKNEIVDEEEDDSSDNIRNVDDKSIHKVHSSPMLPNENEVKDIDKTDLIQNEGPKNTSNGDMLTFTSNENISSDEGISSPQGFTTPSHRKSTPAAIQHGADIAWKILNDLKMRNPSDIVKNGGSGHKWELSPLSKKLWNEAPNCVNTLQQTEKGDYECPHCQIFFGDCIMYTMHMGYHGYKDPYKCNMCGDTCKDRVEFFLHIARAAHK